MIRFQEKHLYVTHIFVNVYKIGIFTGGQQRERYRNKKVMVILHYERYCVQYNVNISMRVLYLRLKGRRQTEVP